MAVTNIVTDTLKSGASTTLTYGSAVTAGSCLVAGGWNYNVSGSPASPAISDSVNGAWTVRKYAHTLTDTNIELWIATLDNTAAGTPVVTWNPNGASADMGGWFICEVTGALNPSLDVVPATSTQTTTTPSIASGTLAQANEVIFALMASDFANTQTITGDGTYTLLVKQEDNAASQAGHAQYKTVASTSSDTADWSFTGSNAGCESILISIKVAAGGGGTPDTYQGPITGVGTLAAGQRKAGVLARIAQQMLFHLPQDVSFTPPPVVAPYVPQIPGEGLALRESKADYVNRALYSTVMLWGGGGDVTFLPPDTHQPRILGERSLQTTNTAFALRSRTANALLWPVPNDQPPAQVLSPPYQAPLVGERLLASSLRQQAIRAQLATGLLIFTPSDRSTAQPQPDTYQPPIVGERALQGSSRIYALRSSQTNALLWPPPQDPAFAPVTVPPLAGEGLWAKALQRNATQSRLAASLLIFAPSDLSGLGTQPITAIQPLPGQGLYAAQQQQYRLGVGRHQSLLWTAPRDASATTTQPSTYQPPVTGEGFYRRSVADHRRRATIATALLLSGSRETFIPVVFHQWWAAQSNKAVGPLIEPR